MANYIIEREQWENLIGLLVERDAIAGEENAKDSYSGRGMYVGSVPEHCIGFTFDSPGQLLAIGACLPEAYDNGDTGDANPEWITRAARMDTLGQRSIVYFPGWQVESTEDEDDTDSDDTDHDGE